MMSCLHQNRKRKNKYDFTLTDKNSKTISIQTKQGNQIGLLFFVVQKNKDEQLWRIIQKNQVSTRDLF